MNKALLAQLFTARDQAQRIADRLKQHLDQLVMSGDNPAFVAILDSAYQGVMISREYYQFRIDELHAQHPVSPHFLPGDHRNLQ